MDTINAVTDVFPSTPAQEQLWSICATAPSVNVAYNLTVMYQFDGDLDAERLRDCLRRLARRHEPLRTFLRHEGNQLNQHILDAVEVPLTHESVGSVADGVACAGDLAGMPFDVACGPLWRAGLFGGTGGGVLVLVFHHVVLDGWSVEVLLAELRSLYAGEELPAGGVQYADYAVWQRERLSGDVGERLREFWRNTLAGMPGMELPVDFPRPAVLSGRGAVLRFTMDAEVVARVAGIAREERATAFSVLLAGFHVLLGRLCGCWDTPVGVPAANRIGAEIERVVGLFVNSVVMRVRSAPGMSFRELVRGCRDMAMDALEHQELPFSWVVRDVAPVRDPGRNPLFQVMFAVDDTGADSVVPVGGKPVSWGENLQVRALPLPIDSAKFDLNLSVRSVADGSMQGQVIYRTDLFTERTVRAYVDALIGLWDRLTADPDVRLGDVALATSTPRPAPAPVETVERVPSLVWRQARRTPDAVAVVAGDETLTFAELTARAETLAGHLYRQGVRPGDIVAVHLPRGADFITSALAVMHLGAAYLPVNHRDGSSPVTARSLGCRGVLAADGYAAFDTPEPAHHVRTLEQLAYVINTSGTTGAPKAVGVTHEALLRYLRYAAGLIAGDKSTLWFSAPFVDLSLPAYLLPLLHGDPVQVVADTDHSLPESVDVLSRQRFGYVRMTPTHVELLHRLATARGSTVDVGCFFVGGEFLTHEHVRLLRTLNPDARILNQYGPTETIIGCAILVVDPDRDLTTLSDPLPVGPPAEDVTMYVLDATLHEVPDGVPGEIYVGGDRLSVGYLGDPARTASTFLPDPTRPGRRMYRTGDRGRRLPGELFEILGRTDRLVKVGANTVDLDAIEQHVARLAGVRAVSAGVTRETGGAVLLLTAEPAGSGVTEDAVRAAAARVLPPTVRPIVEIATPTTAASGKRARPATAPPSADPGKDDGDGRVDPVRAVWRSVLSRQDVGHDVGFFDAGGNSLLLTVLWGRLTDRFPSAGIELIDLFEYPTVREQAHLVASRLAEGSDRP